MSRLRISGFIAALITVLVACGGSHHAGSKVVVMGDGADSLPTETLTDWVGYADLVVQVHVDSEAEQPLTDSVKENHEGLVGRDVTISVTNTLWSRNKEFRAPNSVMFTAAGWTMNSEREGKVPFVVRGAPRIEVGHDYLIAMTSSGAEPGWGPIGPAAVVPFDGGVAGQGERLGVSEDARHSTAAYNQLEGKHLDEVTAIINATRPDPKAAKYASLPAVDRYQHAIHDK